jgi:hypothetical protein
LSDAAFSSSISAICFVLNAANCVGVKAANKSSLPNSLIFKPLILVFVKPLTAFSENCAKSSGSSWAICFELNALM